MAEYTLYDLPTKEAAPRCWSLNAWKGRLVLNFKGVPYKTQWAEYPDIAPLFKEYGISPNSKEVNPTAEYSIPAVKLPDGRYVMDSLAIAHAVEELQPEPPLRLNTGYVERTQAALRKTFGSTLPLAIPRVKTELLPERSAEYFERTRSKAFGMPLADFAKKWSEESWSGTEAGLSEIKALLHENPAGPFVEGDKPGFADLIIAGAMQMAKLLDKDGDYFGRLMGYDESLPRLYEACQKWLARDDH